MTIICPLASYTILVNWHKPYYRHTTLILLIDILQWVVAKQNILKNSLAVEKVCPVQNNQCKKLWNQRGWSRNDCDGIDWWQNFNNNNLGQFVLPCPSFTRNQQKKIFLLIFFHQPIYHHRHFLATPLISQLFSHWPFWIGPNYFYS